MRKFLCKLFNLVTNEQYIADMGRMAEQADASRAIAFDQGKAQAKVHFAVLPLPFTESQLLGREYGDFITPGGFGTILGECSVPAPSVHGYQQLAFYVGKRALERPQPFDLLCHHPVKFAHDGDDGDLVPVIVTVLR